MSEQNISNQWICACTSANPLRKRFCTNCGLAMPIDFMDKIYKEEINIQSIFFRRLKREKETQRCKRMGMILTKLQTLVVVVLIVVSVFCNGVRFYYFSDTMSTYSRDYIEVRGERFHKEQLQLTQHFIGVNQVPIVIIGVLVGALESIGDICEGSSEERSDIHKCVNEEKINHIMEKIMEVKKNVTRKFK